MESVVYISIPKFSYYGYKRNEVLRMPMWEYNLLLSGFDRIESAQSLDNISNISVAFGSLTKNDSKAVINNLRERSSLTKRSNKSPDKQTWRPKISPVNKKDTKENTSPTSDHYNDNSKIITTNQKESSKSKFSAQEIQLITGMEF